MSNYQQRDMSGSLFKNQDKQAETHADYKGECLIDGQAYWMSAWLKTSESGRKWMSFSFKPKQAPQAKPVRARDDAARARQLDSDVPF